MSYILQTLHEAVKDTTKVLDLASFSNGNNFVNEESADTTENLKKDACLKICTHSFANIHFMVNCKNHL